MAGRSAPATAPEPQFNAGLQARDVLRILTRIRLVTRTCGGRLTLHRADPALLTVIDLFGLTDLFPTGHE